MKSMKVTQGIFKNNPIVFWLSLVVIFIVLIVILTFPLIQNFTNSVPATYGHDSRLAIWILWQFRYTLIDLGENPFGWSQLIYYPVGFLQAAGAYDNLYNTVLSIPFALVISNYVVIYNLLLLLNIILSGVGMYLLIHRHFAPHKGVAFITAFAYAFSPYAIHRFLGHINLATVQWIPFFLLFFLSLLKNPTKKNAFWSAIFLFLVGVSSWHYLITTSLVIVFLLIYKIVSERQVTFEWKKFLFNIFMFFVISGVMLLIVLAPFLASYFEHKVVIPSREEYIAFSADPLSYFTPSPLYFYGKLISPIIYKDFSGNIIESTTYLGIGEIALLVTVIFQHQILKSKKEWSKYKKWLWFVGIFYILSLGPQLKVINHVFESIPLPMALLYRIPFVPLARASARMSIFVFIGVIILISIFLFYLSKTISFKKFRYLLITLFALFFIERIMIPLPLRSTNYSPFYDLLHQDTEQYAIIEIPVKGGIEQEYNFLQTVHNKFVSSGEVLHTSYTSKTSSFVSEDPLLSQLICLDPSLSYTPPKFTNPSKGEIKKKYLENNFKYLIIHKDFMEYPICKRAKEIVDSYFSEIPRIYQDDQIEVIKVDSL